MAYVVVKMSLKGKTSRKWANGQNIYDSENKIDPQGFICPCPGTIYMYIVKQIYLYMSQNLSEHLQDNWFSGL